MDFELTEEQKMLKRNAHEFLGREIIPVVDEYERKGVMPKEEAQKFMEMLTPLGYIVGSIPEKYGGLGLSRLSYGLLMEELNYAWAGLTSLINITGGLPEVLANVASDELRAKYLAPAMSGNLIGCSAITEPDVGSAAPRGIKAKAVLDGDQWVINGTKTFITNGCIADICNVFTLVDRGQGPSEMGSILVEREASPYSTREMPKIGLHAASLAELNFEDCRVPKGNILQPEIGPAMGAWVMAAFTIPRAGLGIRACGLAQAALDASIKYAQERHQFGRPIGSFQMIQDMIVDMVIEIEAARFLALHALDRIDKGLPCRKESSMAKAYGCEMAVRVTSKAIQIHGGVGLCQEYPLERYFRDARVMTIPDGTTQIQKLIVGREVLGISAIR